MPTKPRKFAHHIAEALEPRRLLSLTPAFPGAEGYGMFTTGGRGGTVYEVTNLNDSGAGSLRDAVSAANRTIVFRVSGTINLASTLLVDQPNITIAGQTAPGGGITLKNYALRLNKNNIIVRYIRVRPGDTGTDTQVDGISMGPAGGANWIFDHVSASWGIDENFSIYGLPNVTIQWSIISEALFNSKHPSGPHSMGGIQNGRDMTAHHNIYISNNDRNPKFNIADWWPGQNTDFRNNVIYNWGTRSTWGGNGGSTLTNVVNNYYKAGPSSSNPSRLLTLETGNPGEWYVNGNYVYGYPDITANNWDGVANSNGTTTPLNRIISNIPFSYAPVTTQTAEDAYNSVLQYAGTTVPLRDSVDTRVLNDVANGTGALINSQTAVGGWPSLTSTTPPTDTDHDGMPDSFETAHGLNPNNAADRNLDYNGDGYTNVEKYLNSLVPTLGAQSGPVLPSQGFWPLPANGATQEDPNPQLRWKAGFQTTSERIYFGTNPVLTGADFKVEKTYTSQVINKQLITSSYYDPGALALGTTYYWRIDAVNADGVTTGQTWSFTPGLPVAGPGTANREEAEAMTLSRAFIESGVQASVPSEIGTMRYTFNKASGPYRIDVRYVDEGDGAGLFEIYRNSTLIGQWTADTNNDQYLIRTFNNVQLNNGDVIKVVSRRHMDELGRVDYVDTTFLGVDTTAPTVASAQYDVDQGKIIVQFAEPMNSASIQPADAQVLAIPGGATIAASSVVYNSVSNTAAFSFASLIPNGNRRLRLAAGSMTDVAGNALVSEYTSDFFVLAADANRDRHVDDADQAILTAHLGQIGTFTVGDFDYSGTVNAADQAILNANWCLWLPPNGVNLGSVSITNRQIIPPGQGTIHFNTLAITGAGALDLNDNDLIVENGAFSNLQNLVVTGYSSTPDANKTGLVSTAGQTAGTTILALFDNSTIGVTSWSGQTAGASAIIGKYTYFGDADFNGMVTGDDYLVLDANLGTSPPPATAWLAGDMNFDGSVTGDDYLVLDANLGLGISNPLITLEKRPADLLQ